MKILFLSLAILFCTALGLAFWYWQGLLPASQTGKNISFVVSKSQSGSSIISQLQSAGLIRSELASKIYLKLNNLDSQLKPGGYVLNSSQSAKQIFSHLAAGPQDIWITIPEGWRKEQIAARLLSSLSEFDVDEFNRLASPVEGRLFPDTYLIPARATPADVLQIFLKNFTKKTGLNPDLASDREVLIMASLVEREAKIDPDRLLIAGILDKRLKNNWPLQVDATVQYATASRLCINQPLDQCDWWPIITDTKYPSSFNTYLNPGLPPSPICNPGLASIQAARNPQDSAYWFYLTDSSGVTHYASSLTEHNQNVDKYLRP